MNNMKNEKIFCILELIVSIITMILGILLYPMVIIFFVISFTLLIGFIVDFRKIYKNKKS